MNPNSSRSSQRESVHLLADADPLNVEDSLPQSNDIALAWDAAAVMESTHMLQALKGQQSEYGGHLFDQLISCDDGIAEFDPEQESYAQIIPGERYEPEEPHLRAFIAAANLRKFQPRSTIIFGGENCDSVFLLLRGMVSVHIDGAAGREIILDYLSAGEFFGELPMFLKSRQRSAGVKAKCCCEVAELSYARFRALSQQYPDLVFAVATQMANRLVRTTQKVSDLAFLDVTGRVARTLMELSKQPDAVTHPQGM